MVEVLLVYLPMLEYGENVLFLLKSKKTGESCMQLNKRRQPNARTSRLQSPQFWLGRRARDLAQPWRGTHACPIGRGRKAGEAGRQRMAGAQLTIC